MPMDGFHDDDAVLSARGLLPRMGAPEMFDVAGFGHLLARLRRNEETEVAVPVFDRAIEISQAGARIFPAGVDLLVVEGNYLQLDRAPWLALRAHFDTTAWIDVGMDVLEHLLTRRWVEANLPADEVARRATENDLPNYLTVTNGSGSADYIITT